MQAAQPTQNVDSQITGIVHDTAGGIIAGATIVARPAAGAEQQTVSGQDGRFSLSVTRAVAVDLIVRSGGFAENRRTLVAGASRQNLDVVLEPAKISEEVTVTATKSEQRIVDVP